MEKTAFIELFGESPIFKVLDFLIVHDEFDYSMSDIAKLSGVGYSTLKLFWPKLEKAGIVKCTRKVGKAKMFRLNYSNPGVEKFRVFYWAITKQAIHKELKRTLAIAA